MSTRICVIGGGVIGVSSAVRIQEALPEASVTILAETLSPNTTGDVAAGLWRPYSSGNTPQEKILSWTGQTWERNTALERSDISGQIGVFYTSGRELYSNTVEDPFWKDTVLGYRRLNQRELDVYPKRYKSGFFYTTFITDQTKYLPWLMTRFESKGGSIEIRKVNNFEEVGDYDVVVNCTGFGARALCDDMQLVPGRGQVTRAKAPWIKHFTIAPDDERHIICIICAYDSIVMGLTNKEENNLTVDTEEERRILEGCMELEPSLHYATEHKTRVGIRPVRSSVRLEVELRFVNDKLLPIVHNYGHGGSGITLHWGCAQEATQLVCGVVRKSKL